MLNKRFCSCSFHSSSSRPLLCLKHNDPVCPRVSFIQSEGFFYRPEGRAGHFSRYWSFHEKTLEVFPAPSLTRPSFLLCHAVMCLCIPLQLDKRRERSFSRLPLTFTSCFYNPSKARCLHSGAGFVFKRLDNAERHNVISSG